jgi:glycosyltransferase involved in cell wall biosynthesis
MELWMSLIAARAADLCVVSRPDLAEVLQGAGVDTSRITVMPHRHVSLPPDDAAREILRRQLGLKGGPVIGIVRDLCESYDTAVLADVMTELAHQLPALKMLVAGYGRAGAKLRHLLGERRLTDRLVLIDQPKAADLPLYRSLLDVAIFTRIDGLKAAMSSTYEMSCAMAAGSAIVAYRTADAAAMIENGVSGLLCAPGDVSGLTMQVRQVLLDDVLRASLAQGAQQAYLKATGSAAASLSELFAQILGPDRRVSVA